MRKRYRVTAALVATLLTITADCTPLIIGRSGGHIFVATNSIDTNGVSRCKLHFAKHAVVLWATQAASITLSWPNGRTETVDFESALNDKIKDVDEPIDTLKDILIRDAEERIRTLLLHYRASGFDRAVVARDLQSEYVIVGREHNGFIGVRAFTLEVADPQNVLFKVQDVTRRIHNGEVIDYSQGEVNIFTAGDRKAVRSVLYDSLRQRDTVAQAAGNKAFSPPFLVMDVTRSSRTFLSDAGPCSQ